MNRRKTQTPPRSRSSRCAHRTDVIQNGIRRRWAVSVAGPDRDTPTRPASSPRCRASQSCAPGLRQRSWIPPSERSTRQPNGWPGAVVPARQLSARNATTGVPPRSRRPMWMKSNRRCGTGPAARPSRSGLCGWYGGTEPAPRSGCPMADARRSVGSQAWRYISHCRGFRRRTGLDGDGDRAGRGLAPPRQ